MSEEAKQMNIFERNLALWGAVCMFAGSTR